MERYWLGDFRLKLMQAAYEAKEAEELVHNYIYDDFATCTWLASEGFKALQESSPANSSIIIMSGLHDCIQSCLWPSTFDINSIVIQYQQTLEQLQAAYSTCKIYFCSINPVNGDYATSNATDGYISAAVLNNKIKEFNTLMQNYYADFFIDCTDYLQSTSFDTLDGIRYDYETSDGLQAFIISNLQEGGFSPIVPRFTAPVIEGADSGDDSDTSDDYWINTAHGGLSPFSVQGANGSTLPNCVAYAWGRFYEIIGVRPTIFTADAECWFAASRTLDSDWETMAKSGTDYDGYERGKTPRPGSILCWQKGIIGDDPSISDNSGDAGHVAIVEQVNEDGTIITSESGYLSDVFWLKKRSSSGYIKIKYDETKKELVEQGTWVNTGENSWGAGSPYIFQGFIYSPGIVNGNGNIARTIGKNMVTSNNTYLGEGLLNETLSNVSGITDAQRTNALYIWQYLGNKGWTMNAVAALLGNMQRESTLNPGLWQSRREWGSADSHGYGLTQWTPYTKFTNWCEANNYEINDIDVQLLRIEKEVEASEVGGWSDLDQWITTDTYNISFKDFTQSTKDAAWLAGAFLLNYERAADTSKAKQEARGRNATYWYEYLLNNTEGITQKFSVSGFKIDKVDPTMIQASFVITKGVSGSYKLLKGKQQVAKGLLSNLEDGYVKFNITSNIVPNMDYVLKLKVEGELSEDVFEASLKIKTPQSYPKAASGLKFTCVSEVLDFDSKFTFEAKIPSSFGYWSKKTTGYDIILFVNSTQKASIEVTSLKLSAFKLKEKFNFEPKTGDTLQLGVRAWTRDDDSNKIYNEANIRMSEPICLLKQTVNAYLNIN